MQTFITATTSDFGVANLDSKRLNKQLLEGRQIMKVLITLRDDPSGKVAWRNHPAVKMWAGCEAILYGYTLEVAHEMSLRGISFEKNLRAIKDLMSSVEWEIEDYVIYPDWWEDPVKKDKVITTHRASLYRKDPVHYAAWKFDADWVDSHHDLMVCCDRCNYYWPTHKEA